MSLKNGFGSNGGHHCIREGNFPHYFPCSDWLTWRPQGALASDWSARVSPWGPGLEMTGWRMVATGPALPRLFDVSFRSLPEIYERGRGRDVCSVLRQCNRSQQPHQQQHHQHEGEQLAAGGACPSHSFVLPQQREALYNDWFSSGHRARIQSSWISGSWRIRGHR